MGEVNAQRVTRSKPRPRFPTFMPRGSSQNGHGAGGAKNQNMQGRGRGRGRHKPPVNYGHAQGPSVHPGWQQQAQPLAAWPAGAPIVLLPQLNGVQLQSTPDLTLRPAPASGVANSGWSGYGQHGEWEAYNADVALHGQAGGRGRGRIQSPPFRGRGPNLQRRAAFPGGRGRGRQPAFGQGPPNPNSGQPGREGPGCGQMKPQWGRNAREPPPKPKPKKKEASLRKLEAEEAAPKRARVLSPQEIEEAARWREERRKCFPTAANRAEKTQKVAAATAAGAASSHQAEALERQRRLHEVLQLQRRMGIAKAAGTDKMFIPFGGRGGRGGFGRGGRGRGRGRNWVEYHMPPSNIAELAQIAETQAGGADCRAEGAPKMDVLVEGDENASALLGLGDYASSCEEEGEMGDAVKQEPHAADIQVCGEEDEPPVEVSSTQPQFDAAASGKVVADTSAGAERQNGDPVTETTTDGDSLTDEALTVKCIRSAEVPHTSPSQHRAPCRGRGDNRKRKRPGKQCDSQFQHQELHRRPPLLQRLLAKEIRQENSALLQCFRFFSSNNFLQDVGQKPLVFPEVGPQIDALAGLRQVLAEEEEEDISDGEIEK